MEKLFKLIIGLHLLPINMLLLSVDALATCNLFLHCTVYQLYAEYVFVICITSVTEKFAWNSIFVG